MSLGEKMLLNAGRRRGPGDFIATIRGLSVQRVLKLVLLGAAFETVHTQAQLNRISALSPFWAVSSVYLLPRTPLLGTRVGCRARSS